MPHDSTPNIDDTLLSRLAWLDAMAHNASEGLLALHADGSVLFANAAAADLLHISGTDIAGRHISEVVRYRLPADDTPGDQEVDPFLRVLWGETESTDMVYRAHDNAIIMLRVRMAPQRDAQGTLLGAVISLTDITTEQALRESEAQYRLLVESIPVITYTALLDSSQTTLYVSSRIERLLGISPAEYMANPSLWRELMHPDDYGRVMAAFERAVTRGEPFDQEYRLFSRHGRLHWFYEQAEVVRDRDGAPRYLQGVMLDITARKTAEQTLQAANTELEQRVSRRTAQLAAANRILQEQQDTLRSVINAVDDPMLLVTGAGEILAANAAAVRRSGQPEVMLIGANVFNFCPPELLDARRDSLARVLANGLPDHFDEIVDGRRIENHLYPVFDPQHQVARIVICARECAG